MLSCTVSTRYQALTLFSWWAYTASWSGLSTAINFTNYLCKPMGPYATRALPAHQVMIWSYPCTGDQSQQPSSNSELPNFRNILKDSIVEALTSARIRHLLARKLDAHDAFTLQITSEFEPFLLTLTQLTFQLVGSQAEEGIGPSWFTDVTILKACPLSSPNVSSLAYGLSLYEHSYFNSIHQPLNLFLASWLHRKEQLLRCLNIPHHY